MARKNDISIRLNVKNGQTVKKALKAMGKEGAGALKAIDRASKPASRGLLAVDRAANSVKNSVDGLSRRLITGFAVGIAIKSATELADSWTASANKIRAAEVQFGRPLNTLNELADSAKESRAEFGTFVELYSRMARAGGILGKTQDQVRRATVLATKAFEAGGAAASEQRAAILQLSQGLQSGFLAGDELRSIRENAPLLAQAIADAFGVTVGQLKQLGAEGKITSDKLFEAIISGGAKIEAQFSVTEITVAKAFNNLRIEAGRFVNSINDGSGATEKLAKFINFAADNLQIFSNVAVITATTVGSALLGKAISRLVIGLAAMEAGTLGVTISLNAAAIASLTLSRAMASLKTSMAFLGGPLGITIGLLGVAFTALGGAVKRARKEAERIDKIIKQSNDSYAEAVRVLKGLGIEVEAVTAKVENFNSATQTAFDAAGFNKFIASFDTLSASIESAESKVNALKLTIRTLGAKEIVRGNTVFPNILTDEEESRLRGAIIALEQAQRALDLLKSAKSGLAFVNPSDSSAGISQVEQARLEKLVNDEREKSITVAQRLATQLADLDAARSAGIITSDAELEKLKTTARERLKDTAAMNAAKEALAAQTAAERQAAQIRAELGDITGLLAIRQKELQIIVEKTGLTRAQANDVLAKYQAKLDGSAAAQKRWQGIVQAALSPTEKLRAQVAQLNADYDAGKISIDVYNAANDALTIGLNKVAEAARKNSQEFKDAQTIIKEVNEAREKALPLQARMANEQARTNVLVKEGLLTSQQAARHMAIYGKSLAEASQQSRILANTQQVMDGIITGQINSFSDLATAFGRALNQMVFDAILANQKIAGSLGLGGFLGKIFQSFSGFLGITGAIPVTAPGGAGAGGGRATVPLSFGGGKGPSPSTASSIPDVIKQASLATPPVVIMAPQPNSGRDGGLSVVIKNESGAQVRTQTRRGANGNRELLIFLRGMNETLIDSGQLDGAFGRRFGARPVTGGG